MLILDHISKSYNGVQVFEHLSRTFANHSITCIMGDSGAGKTTLLGIMMGVIRCDEGMVSGNENVSAVFQESRLVNHLSAYTNVKMAVGKKDGIEGELAYLLDADSVYKKCSELSGGMKRRVEVVRAMMKDSDVVVMDEPFAGLDEKNRERTIRYILDRQQNRAIIIATHDETDALRMNAQVFKLAAD